MKLKDAFQYTLGADKYCLNPPRIVKIIESTLVDARGQGGGVDGELLFNGDRVSV